MVTELANMVQEAAVVQQQECKADGISWMQMMDTGGFSEKAKVLEG